jgi:glucose-1-phosphate cytidylyltransferase
MKNLSTYGITDFIIATGYKSDMIKEYFLNYEAWNNDFTIELGQQESLTFHDSHEEAKWRVTVAYTGENTMTGGRLLRTARYLDREPFLVTYGDGLANIDITALQDFHKKSGCLATVTTAQPTSRFGVMDVGSDGEVLAFKEKPKLDGWINIGFFIMQPEVIKYLDAESVLEEEPLAHLSADRELSAFRHEGFWQPMDTFRESKILNKLWDSNEAPWRTW